MNTNTSKYAYFVSYVFNGGTGFVEYLTDAPITSIQQIAAAGEAAAVNANLSGLSVTNYQLLSGPDTCVTCGNHGTE